MAILRERETSVDDDIDDPYDDPRKKKGGGFIWIILLVVVGLIVVKWFQAAAANQPPPRTDVTVIDRNRPSAMVTLQPGVDHFLVINKPRTTIDNMVPVNLQLVDQYQNPVSPEVLVNPKDPQSVADRFGGDSGRYFRIRLPDGVSHPGQVWIHPDTLH